MENIKAVNANNWQVGKHYIQTLPKALNFIGIEDDKLLQAYNESLEAFKQRTDIKKLPAGDYEITTVNGKLFSGNIDRLKMLSFETLLKAWTIQTGDIIEALKMIDAKKEPVRKTFGGKKV